MTLGQGYLLVRTFYLIGSRYFFYNIGVN